MSYNKLQSLAENVAAIETAAAIKVQGKSATENEKKTLALYSGFGAKETVSFTSASACADCVASGITPIVSFSSMLFLLVFPFPGAYSEITIFPPPVFLAFSLA